MAQPTLSGLIIGFILVGLVMVGFSVFAADLNETYPTTYDEEGLEVYNKLANISSTLEDAQENLVGIQTQSGVFDILGRFFQGAYDYLIAILESLNVFRVIVNQATGDLRIGNTVISDAVQTAVTLIVITIIFLGIVTAAVVKWRT